ncbi:hypothetical protein XBFM1_2190018 [Xenorhabdus bovienii str. feltiae Moldova]|uniref:Uncharacterized protein n=1 Tax=Xenorhabdus bovienii str. feltiae Moldova TaxID=1398200 RepID=A0A077NV13_XENBV|nr:hypothetical protein XBFM1_2190018 [Xenorhabdus bovienii str. feltiae Moldova]
MLQHLLLKIDYLSMMNSDYFHKNFLQHQPFHHELTKHNIPHHHTFLPQCQMTYWNIFFQFQRNFFFYNLPCEIMV